jgi:hypothetical protein
VDYQNTIRGLLAIFMIAGLVLGPLSRPVMAGTASDSSMAAMADDMSAADEMASDMPCCPTKAPVPVDCDKCVLMTSCMTLCFASPSITAFDPFAASGRVVPLQNDSWPDGLGHPPPEHPPRTLV